VAGIVLFAALAVPASLGDVVLSAGIFADAENTTILHREETAQGIVTVSEVREEGGTWKSLDVDGINVAGTSPGLVSIQKMQGHLPLLLHPAPRSVLHIGFGSGGTAHAVSTHPEVEEIHIVEINPGVIRGARAGVPELHGDLFDDPRVRILYEDGRNYLLATDRRYDVILSDSVHPRYAGNSALYTEDYFRLARSRLRPGGLVSLWLPLYGLSEESFRMLIASVREVFPHTSAWYVNSNVNEFTIVVGRTEGPAFDVDRMEEALAVPSIRDELLPIGAATPLALLDYLVAQGADLDPLVGEAPTSRDDCPMVEYLSARVLDRDASWTRNYQILAGARAFRPDHFRGAGANEELLAAYMRLHQATGPNLEGQFHLLVAGLAGMPAERRAAARAAAADAFARAGALAPEEREPWEWFGLPEAYRVEVPGSPPATP
jgi:spermidine synthase